MAVEKTSHSRSQVVLRHFADNVGKKNRIAHVHNFNCSHASFPRLKKYINLLFLTKTRYQFTIIKIILYKERNVRVRCHTYFEKER